MIEQEKGTRFVAGLLFALLVLAAITLGSPLESFFNPPSLLITVGRGILLTLLAHGWKGVQELRRISLDGKRRQEFEFAQAVAAGTAKQFERIGWIGTGIGLVQMLQNLDDPSAIGPAVAVALLCPLYGHFISAAIFHPMARNMEARSKLS